MPARARRAYGRATRCSPAQTSARKTDVIANGRCFVWWWRYIVQSREPASRSVPPAPAAHLPQRDRVELSQEEPVPITSRVTVRSVNPRGVERLVRQDVPT